MTSTQAITSYIDRLRHRAAQMDERAAQMRDDATDVNARSEALDQFADALEIVRDRTPITIHAMVDFFVNGRVDSTEGDVE
ncbi:MAG: hypothetical protein F4Z82_08725 [Caldilineaceae bacterium SB0668_bin_21]|nr:hypothetical protein [Caldilineaceae bacterium SB0668_bin_21]MYB60249.1 hypothetical protein [Gemmatimonadota bacterium]